MLKVFHDPLIFEVKIFLIYHPMDSKRVLRHWKMLWEIIYDHPGLWLPREWVICHMAVT